MVYTVPKVFCFSKKTAIVNIRKHVSAIHS